MHLGNDSVSVKANAVISNSGGEDLKSVRLKLVAGLSPVVQPYLAKGASQSLLRSPVAAAPAMEAIDMAAAPGPPQASWRPSTSSSWRGEKTC